MPQQTEIPVVESSQIGEARRLATRFAEMTNLSEAERGKVGIIATELATNLVRHAQEGRFLIQNISTEHGTAVEMLAVDSGPGISDIDRCLQDGFSTAGTSGNGLGAIKRLSSEFDIYSSMSSGTVIVSRVTNSATISQSISPFTMGAISIPMPGETVCGDSWTSQHSEFELSLMVTDGLGHGPLAAEASNAADAIFPTQAAIQPNAVIQAAHAALSGTRGAALAVACIDTRIGQVKYAGIGNIFGSLLTAQGCSGLVSYNGIVGLKFPKLREFDYPYKDSALLIMHSDGLRSHWNLADYPGLLNRHPALIAGILYRDCRRGRDDSTVVVIRINNGKA